MPSGRRYHLDRFTRKLLQHLGCWLHWSSKRGDHLDRATTRLCIAVQAIEHGYALLTMYESGFVGLSGLRLVMLQASPQA